MIIAAALCPSPPLLVPGLTGAAQVADDLRQACRAALSELVAADPAVIAVVGAGEPTRRWPPDSRLDVTAFAPNSPRSPPGASTHRLPSSQNPLVSPGGAAPFGSRGPLLPASLGVGAWLVSTSGFAGELVLQSVAGDEPVGRCLSIGAELAGTAARTALLVLADGSACRNPKAPGYFDERSVPFDAEVERAVRTGDLGTLRAIDAGLAGELMATGRPGWQVLSGALNGDRVATLIRYCDDPFGVAYLVASLRVERGREAWNAE